MDILGWLAWMLMGLLGLLWTLLGLAWTVVWFLISGWVSTLLQIAVLVGAIFFLKYGWQRAPAELLKRATSLGRFAWGWVRTREPSTAAPEVRQVVRVVHVKEPGDINVSTLLSLLMLAGLALTATLQ
ncbi:MAG TPA: hypothetical protein VFY92_11375 [Hyphomicrobiaceae bacterium]|nr:hypothetical protein [Hyphomicrobiaceae bacterium]